MREATYEDAARLAYGILCWDRELPEFLRTIGGSPEAAFRAAELMCGPEFSTWVTEEDGEIVGCISIMHCTYLYGFKRYGNIVAVFVLPKYRGHRLLGLKLINKALELRKQLGWEWLYMNPWADDKNTHRVLRRLGFDESVHTYVAR